MSNARTYPAGLPASETERPRPAKPLPPPRQSPRGKYRIFAACLKIVLPVLAVGLILIVVIWPQFSLKEGPFRIRMSDITLEQSGRLTMLNARFEGVDDKNQPYTLTADEARQSTVAGAASTQATLTAARLLAAAERPAIPPPITATRCRSASTVPRAAAAA